MAEELTNRYNGPYNPNPTGDEFHYVMYNLVPAMPFNLFATIAYGFVFGAHAFWFARYKRTRWIQGLMMMSCAWQLVAYALRTASRDAPFRGDYFVGQYVITMFAPLFIVIAMLLALHKALKTSDDGRVAVFNRPKAVPMTLIGYQVLVAIIIIIGATMWCVGNARILEERPQAFQPDIGKYIILVGLGNQVGVLTVFQAVLTWTFISIRRESRTPSRENTVSTTRISRLFLGLLFLSVGMIWVRSIFRLVESQQGFFGPAFNSEVYFGTFEFAQVFTGSLIWAVWPFGKSCESDDEVSRPYRRDSESGRVKLVA